MPELHTSKLAYLAEHPDALAVYCSDGRFTGAVAELLAEELPTKMKRIGMRDHFGESGNPEELLEHFGLTAKHIVLAAHELIANK